MPAEYIGKIHPDENGVLTLGELSIPLGSKWGHTEYGIGVYVRRSSDDLSVMEIHMARHDGLAQEELDEQNYWGTSDEDL